MGICIFADQLIFYSVDQLIYNSIYHKIYPIVQYYKAISLRTILKLRVKFVLNTVTSRMFVWHLRQCIMLNVVEIVASVYVYCLMLFRKFAFCLLLKCLKCICRTYKLETQSGMSFTLITLLNYLTLQYFNIERTLETRRSH